MYVVMYSRATSRNERKVRFYVSPKSPREVRVRKHGYTSKTAVFKGTSEECEHVRKWCDNRWYEHPGSLCPHEVAEECVRFFRMP